MNSIESDSGTPESDARVWLCDLTYTQQTIAADVIPNAIGGIASFLETQVSFSEAPKIFKYPEKLIALLEKEGAPEILAFSNYVWNFSLSLEIAKVLRARFPETVIIFGGPNYPTTTAEQEAFLRQHDVIDFYIVKEGERAFASLCVALIEQEFDCDAVKRMRLPSVHAITQVGEACLPNTLARITDLSDIPSPYTTGRLDEFFDGKLLPIIQTNRGCPFACTFCVEGDGYYNKVRRNNRTKIDTELDYIGGKMERLRAQGGRNDLFIADSNFGMYREDLDTARTLALARKNHGWPEYINVATGKNQKERVLEASRIIDGALRLSGSVQSLDPDVLGNIKRTNIDAEGLFDLGLRAGEVGANTYSEVILGLPGDSLKAHLDTVRTVMSAGFTNIYLFQLMLLPGTEMATPESKAEFGMCSKYRVLPRCYGHYRLFGQDVISAEIEEICVAGNHLSFEDYLQARKFHLVVTIFYNDGIFEALIKLLNALDVPVFDWVDALLNAPLPSGLQPLFDSFETATIEELWDTREDLETFVREKGVVEKFIDGELGNNLLFVHKTRGITVYLDQLGLHARQTLLSVLDTAGHDSDNLAAFVDDALSYHFLRAKDLFENNETSLTTDLAFDIDGFLNADADVGIDAFALGQPVEFRFEQDAGQKELVDRFLSIYGSSAVSIGRILSKVHVKKLFRKCLRADGVDAESGAGAQSAKQADVMLSGLQQ